MQRMYIRRNGKDILLTEDEMWKAFHLCQEEQEKEDIERYKKFCKRGLINIGHPGMAEDNEFIIEFAGYMYRLITQKDCDFDWCFSTEKYGGFRECYADMIDIIKNRKEN